jgi:hypothetical protein
MRAHDADSKRNDADTRTRRVALLALSGLLSISILGACDDDSNAQLAEPPDLPAPAAESPPQAIQEAPVEAPAPTADPLGATPEATATGAEAVTEVEVETFIEAQLELVTIQQQLSERAQAGASEQELQQLRGALQTRAAEVVEESDLTPERFDEIASMAERDEALQQRLRAAMVRQMGG